MQGLIEHNVGNRSLTNFKTTTIVSNSELLSTPLVWSASDNNALPSDPHEFPHRALLPLQRVVIDALLTKSEINYFANEALDRFGDPLFTGCDEDGDAVAWPDWGESPLNDRVCELAAGRVRFHFGEDRPLALAGAMIVRKTPRSETPELHVDQANKGLYDYSVVVYLSTQGEEFDGGSFVFRDAEGDESVEPKAGRCLLFSSGFHHLHQVLPVTRGERVVMGLWFTLQVDKID